MITLNGERSEIDAGESIESLLARLGLREDAARGVAVAVDGEVVPRGDWSSFALGENARVEVLTAAQGG